MLSQSFVYAIIDTLIEVFMGIGYKRDGRYPRRFSVNVTAVGGGATRCAAARYGIAPSTLARDALERGLPLMLDARRRRGGTQAGTQTDK